MTKPITIIESELATHKDKNENPFDLLTKREFQILILIAGGSSYTEIAEKFSISPKTVSVHYLNLKRKLKLQNTTQLIRLAINRNVING